MCSSQRSVEEGAAGLEAGVWLRTRSTNALDWEWPDDVTTDDL
jgi:hypothetical protein